MPRTFDARNRVAIAGYAQSPVTRHAGCSLGALTLETARRAIGDAGLRVDEVDGFVTASLFPTSGAHAASDGTSLVSANWLAEHFGVNPRYAAGFQGMGQIPGAVAMAVNAVASGAADYVLVHRALHNPQGSYHGNPMTEARGDAAVDRTARVLRPGGHDRVGVQRVPATLRRRARGHGHGRRRGPQERVAASRGLTGTRSR